jgi:pimeloyl-ACP methyl ester carboxylesterase
MDSDLGDNLRARIACAPGASHAHDAGTVADRASLRGDPNRSRRLPDGRRIGVAEYGAPAGLPVVYCHGFPSSRLEAALAHAQAAAQGLRLIAIDRPRFGLSDPKPGRRLTDWPEDVATLMDALGVARFAVLGVSGGAPYALACAAGLPGQVSAVAIVAGLGPLNTAPVGVLPWYGELARVLAVRRPRLARVFFAALVAGIKCAPERLLRSTAAFLAPADQAVLARAEVRAALLATFREAARQGSASWAQEFDIYVRDWGFDLGSIRAPVWLWHGEHDRVVSPIAGRRLAAELTRCHAHFLPEEGHYSLPLGHMADIFARLRAHARG